MILVSPYPPREVFAILEREVDAPPSIFRAVLTLNASYFVGTARVCGSVSESGFELRSRNGPGFSLRANGTFAKAGAGTEIVIAFAGPALPDILGAAFGRYRNDQETIVTFLKEHLRATEKLQ